MKSEHDMTSGLPKINEGRRKLTKVGLAVPAVLGTLASKPVLANVPWKCTISGQVSGNVSGHENETCNTLGSSHAELSTTFSTNQATKLSDLFSGLTVFFHWNGTTNSLTTASSDPEATVYQILSSTAPTGLEYAQKAVVILLNAKSIADTTLYPLTESQAKNLYIAAATGGYYTETSPPVNWSNAQVTYYIDLLYH